MPSNQDIAFVLVPGSFSTPVVFDKVTERLTSRGYTVVGAPLKSATDTLRPAAGMHDDALAIREIIQTQLSENKSVVLAMNSYGGIPGSEAVKGLSQSDLGPGKPAVIALVYIAAILVPEGVTSNERLGGGAAQIDLDDKGNSEDEDPYMHLDGSIMAPIVFSDIPDPELQMRHFNAMPNHSKKSFDEPLNHAGYKYIPSTYILPDADQVIKPEIQREMLETANKDGAEIKTVVFEGSGHVPMLSRPDEVTKVLLEAAGQNVV